MSELVHLEVADGVGTVTLDSPENRNALSRALVADLYRQLEAASTDDRVRVIVLTGAGTVFCSGADLKEQLEANVAGAPAQPLGLVDIIKAIWESPKPVLGRIQGPARAGGVGLMAACDISVVVDTATFAFTEVRLGLAAAIISVVTLPKMPKATGLELFLTGEPFSASDAVRYGLVNAAVRPADLDAAVAGYAEKLAQGGPHALGVTKRMVREVPALAVDDAFAQMASLSARMFASEEAREGMSAFREKRSPRWAGPP
jgi:methylglutaconyl-CoA hydratase